MVLSDARAQKIFLISLDADPLNCEQNERKNFSLLDADPSLFKHVMSAIRSQGPENLTSAQESALLASTFGLTVSRCLVDCISLDLCLYVWDTAMMCSFFLVIPRVLSALLVCLKESVMTETSEEGLMKVLYEQGKTVSVGRLHTCMERHVLPKIRQVLGMKTNSMNINSRFKMNNDEGDDGMGEVLMGDEAIKQVLARMDIIANMTDDQLPNELTGSGKRAKTLGRRVVAGWDEPPAGLMGVVEGDAYKAAAPVKSISPANSSADKSSGGGGKNKNNDGIDEGGGDGNGDNKEGDDEAISSPTLQSSPSKAFKKSQKKAQKKLEKRRMKDFEEDVSSSMLSIYGRVYTAEEITSLGPMDRRKYNDSKEEMKKLLADKRNERISDGNDEGLKDWTWDRKRIDGM